LTLRLASRGSTLALWQARHVLDLLRSAGAPSVEIDVLQTTGDRITDVPLAMIGDRGLFTKEVDAAVLDGRAQLAVHSLKDVPTVLTDGLTIAAVLRREDPRDAFVPAPTAPRRIGDMPAGARIGTSSLRRRALLLALRPDLVVEDLRGNLDTRLDRVATAHYDGIVLALAGLRRLGGEDRVGETLDPPHWLPATGQGALAVVVRDDDQPTLEHVRVLDHADTRAATDAERSFLRRLEGGCQIPVGALAEVTGPSLRLRGLVASLDGASVVRGEAAGAVSDAVRIGEDLAEELLERGADSILHDIRASVPHPQRPPAP
jgi:hydroxymethylbilane synthase